MQINAVEGLAALDLQEGKPAQARARVAAAVDATPTSEALQLLAGRVYVAVKDTEASERAFRKAIELNPHSFKAYAALGQLFASSGKLPEAAAEFEGLIKKLPQPQAGPFTALGTLLELQNRRDEAAANYKKALEVDPRAAVAANNLAWMYAERGEQLDTALQLAQTATAELPDNAEVRDTLGWVYCKKGLWRQALPLFEQNVKAAPDNGSYWYRLGVAQNGAGDVQSARASLEKALAINSRFAEASEAQRLLNTLR